MLTFVKIVKESTEFCKSEKDYLMAILGSYSKTDNGDWINDIDYRDCKYYWCNAMNADNGVLGARPLFGESIYLAAMPNNSCVPAIINSWIESLAPTAIHELRHLWQQQACGKVLWSIIRLPEVIPALYGKVIMEKDAFEIQNWAEEWINESLMEYGANAYTRMMIAKNEGN